MSLTYGMGEDPSGFLAYGLGYISIVVIPTPTPPVIPSVTPIYRPRIIRVPIEIGLKLKELGLLKEYRGEFPISPLSLIKLQKIQILISELKLQVPEYVSIFLHKLELMEKEGKEFSTEELKIIVSSMKLLKIEPLYLLKNMEENIRLSSLNYLESKIIELKVLPPDIYKIKIDDLSNQLKKYLELLELLESISED